MNTTSRARFPGRRSLACAFFAPLFFLAVRGQSPVVPISGLPGGPVSVPGAISTEALDPYYTTATRTPVAPNAIGSAVDALTAADVARRQVNSLAGALGGLPGAPAFASGATGGSTSLFLRGANSNQTLFLVDGIRLNDPNTDYAVFLGGACLGACDSLEVSHGPQSTLYGGEAVGGVVALRSDRGRGAPTARVAVEGGSFGTLQGALSAQGERGAWGYVFSAAGGHTDNDRANNAFDSGNVTLRLDRAVNARLAVGATLRGFQGVYGSPGDRFTNDPDNQEREGNWLATVFAEFKPAEALVSKVVVGGQERRFVSENPRAGRATQFTEVNNRRAVLDWQNTYAGIARHRVTAGLTAEANHTRNTGFGAINESQSLLAFFAQDEFTPVENVFLTAGLRSDDHDTFGRAATGRVTAAWLALPDGLKLRASYGTAFRSPGFLDLYGRSAFYVGNPNLAPERARGWDAGVDFYLPGKRGTLSVTWFESRLTDLIVYDFAVSPSTTANVDRARTRGVEFSARTTLPAGVALQLAYTYLEADNLTAGTRLLRRPRHSASVDVWRDFGGGFSAGVGAAGVVGRKDVNAATFATIDGEDYVVARLYGAWAATDRLTVKARVENLFDEAYEEVNGYPQPGVGAYTGVEWRF